MNIILDSLPKNEALVFEYQFFQTPKGKLLIASWKKHIAFIAFVENQSQALGEMRKRFPKVVFVRTETPIQRQVLKYIKNPKATGTVPVAVQGSPFQIKVWKALLEIPFGSTCFYSDLARAVQQPTAVRAAASAVAKNPVAILIPCHRVLPRGGGVGNYHWGSKNKSTLLTWESLEGAPKKK